MRLQPLFAAALLLAPLPAFGQSKAGKTPAGPEVRYFTAIDGLMDGQADVVLRQLRQGRTVQSATLDMCYPADAAGDRKDRFVATLSPSGGVLTGTAQSQIDKQPVSVRLTQRAVDEGFELKGQISIGSTSIEVASSGNSDLSEAEYQELQPGDDGIEQNRADYTTASPEAVSVKLRLDAAADFLKSLRGQNVEVTPSSIAISCENLRSGTMTIALVMDPMRAPAFVASTRGQAGVVTAGWSAGLLSLERSVRFPAASWREGDRINRDKIKTALADALAPVLNARLDKAAWSDATGKLKLRFKRPSQLFASLGLTEVLDVSALVAPEKPSAAADRLLLWVGTPDVKMSDESEGAKLNLGEMAAIDEDTDSRTDARLMQAVTKAFGAQTWDAETSTWK
jgi:hypothetical protein